MRHRSALACVLTTSLLLDVAALAQPAPAPPPASTPPPSSAPSLAPSSAPAPSKDAEAEQKEEARKYFEKGLLLFDEETWDGALAEFLRSREIYPSRAATKNAAICLRKLKRFDEALDMFEQLLKLPNLPAPDKDLADHELPVLRGLVGTLDIKDAEPGASIIIDGRNRGTTPVAPIRITVGTHVVRVYKEGFEAFEARVDVAGGASKPIQARLAPLVQSGRLKVIEKTGKALDVVVDNAVVGKTPWDGPFAPGEHTVLLRGEGDLGTQPATVPVRINQITPLTLVAEPLAASLRMQPTPTGASIAIDGVSVGRGLWEGRLRAGKHRLEVAAEGFLPQARDVTLGSGKAEITVVTLERDPNSPLWTDNRGRFFVEVDGAFGLIPSFGGDLAAACKAPCAGGLGLGFLAVGHGGYRFRGGFLVGVDAGYVFLRSSMTGRATTVLPMGLPADPGKADDTLTLGGTVLGASAGIRVGSKLPLTFRLGAGAFFGSLKEHRTGTFSTIARSDKPSVKYQVDVTESPSATSLYVAPEIRLGLRLGQNFELSLGAEALVLLLFTPPAWVPKDKPVLAATDGQGTFAAESFTSKAVLVVTPGLGAKYEF